MTLNLTYDEYVNDLEKVLTVDRYSLQNYYLKKLNIYLHGFFDCSI